MVSGVLSTLQRIRVTVVYAAILVAVATVLVELGPRVQERVIDHASTNLHNLAHGRIGTLVGSAFVMEAGPIYLWLPGLVCLLAVAELVWRSGRLVIAFTVGHVGATLVVAAGLVTAVKLGWLPVSVSRATDVGMSYGAAAVLGALTSALPVRWRPIWIGWWVAVAVSVAALSHDFTDVGHGVALVLGMVVSTRFGVPDRWTPVRYLLLGAAAMFGFMLLANTGPAMVASVGAGLVGAAGGWAVARRGALTRSAVIQLDPSL